MSVKLRLRRQGRKGSPYYHIVAADARSPRDGKFLEKIGSYNPVTNPASIELDNDAALRWLKNGAQPTDTVKAILRYTGVNLRFALHKQGKSEEEAEKIYNNWLAEKEASITAKKDRLAKEAQDQEKAALDRERKIKEERAAALAAKNAPAEEEAPAEEAAAEGEEAPAAEAAPEAEAEAPAEETPAE